MKKTIIAAACMVSFSVSAQPSSTVEYLMGEPVTLFDRGLRDLGGRVNESLMMDQFPELIQNLRASAGYDWDANRITIRGTLYQDGETLEETPSDDLCRRVVNRIKFNLAYSEETAFLREIGAGGIASLFRPVGFSSVNEPATLEKDIANITRLEISVHASGNNRAPFTRQLTCVSNLTDSEIFYKEG